jgi:hypothetical protein
MASDLCASQISPIIQLLEQLSCAVDGIEKANEVRKDSFPYAKLEFVHEVRGKHPE